MNELTWIAEAKKFVSLKEVKGAKHNPEIVKWLNELGAWWRDDETAWCGTFVAHCLKKAGVKYPKHWYRALDYLNGGTRLNKPAYGCVAIKARKGGGHVCFVVGKTAGGNLVCLGGNQSDQVCYAVYREADFEQFRWYGTQANPAITRYDLPIIKNVTATKVSEA